ncbi:hypothetical protein GCM10009592_28510 [Brachybacterium rhamnosum]|uniref:Uncharacterized protein n=1 Tax=Brachybacterium rhamnosum TaxID=173361 RepID=A0ABW4Q3Y7_9MICO
MKTLLARTTLTAAVAALLAAIWAPGPWWSWLLTAAVLGFVGAGLSAPEHPDDVPESGTDDVIGNVPSTLERITTDDVTSYKRQYGRKANQ